MLKLLWVASLVLAGGLVAVPPAGAVAPTGPVAAGSARSPTLLPPCDPDCPPPPLVWDSTLSVSLSQGSVLSDTFKLHRIACPNVCSVTDSQTGDVRPVSGWHQYRLTPSGGPPGFLPFWSGCDSTDGSDCLVVNDQETRTVTLTWQDRTRPVVTFNPPARAGRATTLTASATDNSGTVASYRWFVDGALVKSGTPSTTGSLQLGSSLSEGPHEIWFEAVDGSGNLFRAARTVEYDVSTSLIVGPLAAYVNAPPTLTFSSDDVGVRFDCVVTSDLDAGLVPSCTSPWTLSATDIGGTGALPDGDYTFQVRATDDVGNTASSSERHTVLDRTAPALNVSAGPAEGAKFPASSASITVGQVETNPGTWACTLDGSPVTCAAGSPTVMTGLVEGAHTFVVTAVDLAGNHSRLTRHFTRERGATQLSAADATSTYGHGALLRTTGLASDAIGDVTFAEAGTTLCTAPVTAGAAECRAPAGLAAGDHAVSAAYPGDELHAPATVTFQLVVARARTSVRGSASPPRARHGKRVTLSATRLPGAATGKVTFERKGHALCRAKVRDGRASCRTSRSLARGTYRVVAVYAGARNFAASSDRFTFRITR